MASFKQDVKEGLRERIENNTGIVGSVLRDRREQREKQAQIENEVAEIKKVTGKIKVGGTTLVSMERSFTQISENLQLIAKAFKAQATTFEETQAAYKPQQNVTTARPKQQAVIQKLVDEKDDVSILDRISNLIDNFENKRKKQTPKQTPASEAERKKRERAAAEQKELEKNKEKTRAQAERAQQAAKEEARAAGKSAKQVEQAGKNAAKKVVKAASADAVTKVARKIVLAKIGRAVFKSLPIIGTAVSVAFVVDSIWDAIKTNNYTKVGAEALGIVPIVGGAASAIEGAAAETYMEMYGTDYLTDKANGVEGADEAYLKVHKIVEEEFEKAVKEALNPIVQQNWDAKRKARAAKTSIKSLDKEQAKTALSSGLSDKELEDQFEGGRAALEQVAGIKSATPIPPTPAPPPVPSAKPSTEEQIRAIAKQKIVSGKLKLPDATVGDAIKSASQRVGVDESIMLAMAQQESGFVASAKAGTSSAKGLFQFIDATWQEYVRKFANIYPELLKGPLDPLASAIAGALYIKDNSAILKKNNIPVSGTSIYAGHFLGAGGAVKLLSADPNTPAALIPGMARPAAANQYIFFKPGADKKPDISQPRTAGEVTEVLYNKVGAVAEQYATLQQTPTSGQNIDQASTDVASAKKAQQAGSSVTVVAVNNNTQTKMGAANRPPQSQTTAVVGA